MHPILFRIPLPSTPLKIWWGLAAVVALALIYALFSWRRGDKSTAAIAGTIAIAAGVAARVYRAVDFSQPHVPIYSYGVMLGASLVVGWYITLSLAERDGLPKETMANCYVATAVAAIIGSRVLYIATNMDEFKTFSDVFALRRGGLVAYGGFLGGLIGSWAYLSSNKIRLMPWADVAVPSLASGLFITRIGCYLFGCDFGTKLSETAPEWLKKLGTFPAWPEGTLDSGQGSPAYVRSLELYHDKATALHSSVPVHPTQIYESLCGLILLGLLLWQRKNQKFRGQIFFLFVFAYGVCRFILEIIRDDVERGTYGPVMAEHVLVPGALLLMTLGFVFGIALGIKDPMQRTVARVVAFAPPIAAYILLKPVSFGNTHSVQLSTSQWFGLISALLVAFFYARFWEEARRSPTLAMSLGNLKSDKAKSGDTADEDEEKEAAEDDDEDEIEAKRTAAASPRAKKKKKGLVKRKQESETETEGEEPAAKEPGEPELENP